MNIIGRLTPLSKLWRESFMKELAWPSSIGDPQRSYNVYSTTNSGSTQSENQADPRPTEPPENDWKRTQSPNNSSSISTSSPNLEIKSVSSKQKSTQMDAFEQVTTSQALQLAAFRLLSVSSELEEISKTLRKAFDLSSLPTPDTSSPSSMPSPASPFASEQSNGTYSETVPTWTPAKQETLTRLLLEFVGQDFRGREILSLTKNWPNIHFTGITLTDLCARSWGTGLTMEVNLKLSLHKPRSHSES